MKNIKTFNNNNLIVLFSSLVIITLPLKSNYNSITIILFLTFSSFFLFSKQKELIFKPQKELLILLLPFLFIIFQFTYSKWDDFLRNLIRNIPLLLFPIYFYYLKNWLTIIDLKKIMKSLIFSAVAYSLFLLFVAFYRQLNYSPDFSRINWYYFTYFDFTEALKAHPTYLGLYNCLAISILLQNFFLNNKNKILNLVLIIFLSIIVFMLGSRISLICLIIIFCYLFFSFFREISKTFRYVVLFLFISLPLIIFSSMPIIKERMIDMTFGLAESFSYAQYGNNTKYDGGISPRLDMWKCAIEITKDRALLGNGYGYTQDLLNRCYRENGYDSFANLNYQTHNQYLNNYARGGIIGLIVLLILYFYSFYYSIVRKDRLHTSFLVLIIVTSLTENLLNLHFGIVLFAYFNSFFFFRIIEEQ